MAHFVEVSPALEALALAASCPLALAALEIPGLQIFESQLRSTHYEWTARARVNRAFRSGLVAKKWLSGQPSSLVSPKTPYKNTIYIVLRYPGSDQGFWTTSDRTYLDHVGDRAGLQPDSVSHGFASRAEVSAYLAGASRPWPEEK